MSAPNPGSPTAIELGCKCSPWDNNSGHFAPMGDEWHIAYSCPIHEAEPTPGQ